MLAKKESAFAKGRVITRRMFVLSAAKALIFCGIIGRLYTLQVSDNKKYSYLSDKNRLREWKLPPKRGLIKDYFGNHIADNRQVFQLHVIPKQVEDFNYLFVRLKNIINISNYQIKKIYEKKKKQMPWETLVVSENLSWEEFTKLNLFLHELNGVKPVFSLARIYPYANDLAHVIGYVSEASVSDIQNNKNIRENHVPGLRVGKSGLEKTLENDLIGKHGMQRFEVNAYGKRISRVNQIDGTSGKTFILTIDQKIQNYAQNLLTDKSGSICVMDIYSGDIIAMSSSPTFDPNKFVHGISLKEWNEINNDPLKPLMNKSLSGLYSPGSTIKPIVALSALDFDTWSPKNKIRCTGEIELYGQKYRCWKKKGHGVLSLRNAIKQSCDVYFYELSRLLGVDRLSITAKKFGFGQEHLKDFYIEEKKGIVPSTKWKLKNLGKGWVLGETLITGIGQGYIQATPLQLCLMVAQLANGGFKIKPRIIDDNSNMYELVKNKIEQQKNQFDLSLNKDLLIEQNDQALTSVKLEHLDPLFRNPENVKFVLDAMFGSTNEPGGTSYRSRYEDKRYQFVGKTGTAQVRRITEEEREADLPLEQIPYKNRDHAIYIAYGPYENPRYAVSVFIEHGGTGSKIAAPLAKKMFKKLIDRHEKREQIRLSRIKEI